MHFTWLTVLAALPALATLQTNPPCLARLALHEQDGLLRITSSCRSQLTQPAYYRYELRTLRQGPSGNSRTVQGGRFELPPQQQVQLSQVGLGTGADSHYRIQLVVFDEADRAVAQDSISR